MLKLLSKREIDTQKAQEYARERQEGYKLAKRVDSLREIHAQEEASLEKFRIKTLSAIKAELDAATAERDKVFAETKAERERARLIQGPLEAELVTLLGEERLKTDTRKKELLEIDSALEKKRKEVEKIEREAMLELQRAEDEKRRSAEMLVQTQKLHTEAKEELADVRNKNQIILSSLNLRENEVEVKAANVAARERDIQNQVDKIRNYERRLAERELALKDGWKTLLETKKELGI